MVDTTVYPFGLDAPPAPSAADVGTLITGLRAGQLASREEVRVGLKCLDYGVYTFYGPPAPGPAPAPPAPPPAPGPLKAAELKSHCVSAASALEAARGDLKSVNWGQLIPLIIQLLQLALPLLAGGGAA